MLLFAVDGNYYLHKIWFTIANKHKLKKEVLGRLMAKKMLDFVCTDYSKLGATHCVVAFDGGRNFRYDLYPMYKANRNPDGDGKKARERGDDGLGRKELYQYLPQVIQLLKRAGIPVIQHPLYEADDILASLAQLPTNVVLGTRDKDLFQILNAHTRLWFSEKGYGHFITLKDALKKWGLRHDQFIEYQTLLGDPGDNVPTIPFRKRTGPKTIQKLLATHGTIRGIYAGGTPQERQVLIKHQKQIKINRQLVTMVKDVLFPKPSQLKIKKVTPEPGWPASYLALSDGDKLFGSTKSSSLSGLLRGRRR